LKFLAQDLLPQGQPLPVILTQAPPVDLDDDEDQQDIAFKTNQSEMRRLRQENVQLREDVRNFADRSQYPKDVQTSA
jgi:hypothetical protein